MSINKNLAVAALAGLMSATFTIPASAGVENGVSAVKAEKTYQAGEKHACKGQNACKGQGADGKNDCKGKGSCATDGSK